MAKSRVATPIQDAVSQRRLGTFLVPWGMIDRNPDDVAKVFVDCIVVRAELRWDVDAIEYVAYRPEFASVDPGACTPRYRALFYDGKVEWTT